LKELTSIFKNLAYLIDYPNDPISDIKGIGQKTIPLLENIDRTLASYLEEFLKDLNFFSNGDIQEHYTNIFDFSEKTTLYLTYFTLKESKKRGEVLIEISEIFKKEGFSFPKNQLFDHLPSILLFLSFCAGEKKIEEAGYFSKKYVNKGLSNLLESLLQAKSPYMHLIRLTYELINSKKLRVEVGNV